MWNFMQKHGNPFEWLVAIFGLRTYKSEKILTTRARLEQIAFAVVLTLMLIIEVWAWSRAWCYGLGGIWLPLVLGGIFGLTAVLFDRSLIVADTTVSRFNGWGTVGGRAVLLVLVSFLTAVPVELAVFESEITRHLEDQEKQAADKIRIKAIAEETARFDGEITELQIELAAEASLTQGNAETDLKRFQQERVDGRRHLVEAVNLKHTQISSVLKEKSDQVALESAGQGPSGKYGNGPAFQAMRTQETQAHQDLSTADQQGAVQLADYDSETTARTVELTQKRDNTVGGNQIKVAKKLTDKRKEKKAKIEELRTMTEDKLAALYGGQWRLAKGFLARYNTLSEMSDADKNTRTIVWGCRLSMILIGMFILGLKLMSSQELKLYYSLAAQAKNDDEGAKLAVSSMGHNDHSQYGNSVQVREILEKLHVARIAAWKALWALEKSLATYTKADLTGIFKSRVDIEGLLHCAWLEKGADALARVSEIEEELRLLGATVPNWPEKMGSDPRGTDPWKVTEQKLQGFGWQKPDQKLAEVKQAKADLIARRRELRKLTADVEFELHQLIHGEPMISKMDVDALRMNVWETKFVPILDAMSDCEFLIAEVGQKAPDWPSEFADPRPGLFERICKLENRDLVVKYGWKGAVA